jgi:uncharacterized membrane protein
VGIVKAGQIFIFLSVVGVAEAFYHAWQENAFTTNWLSVNFGPYASFLGIPYWILGVVWFPLVLVVGAWTTRLGRSDLMPQLLILLTVGNIVTGYFWYLDLVIVKAFTATYVGLYVTNYVLTGLVVAQNWSRREMREFTIWTVIGTAIGAFFGGFGAAAFGITGGIFGAIGGYTSTR